MQGQINRFVILTFPEGHLSVSLVPSALLSVDLGHEAHEDNSVVSAKYTYSAVNAIGASSLEEPSTSVAFNKMCYL